MLNVLITWHRNRGIARELSRLSDHALADLGLARDDIAAVAEAAAGSRRGPEGELAPSWGHHIRASVTA